MNLKNNLKYTLMAAFIGGLTACGDFGDTNIDPEHLNEGNVPYTMVFTNAQHQALGSDWDVWRNGVIYASQWNQHIACGGWYWNYGLNVFNDGYSSALWDAVYSGDRGAVRDVTTALNKWKEDPALTQNYQIARIMRVYIMSRLTDLYGDIPYSQAGQPDKYSYPVYDKQEDIYNDMLKELDEAQANLGTGIAPISAHDIYYQGDVSKWKKFANSLMLRLAMRLTKVSPEKAKTYAAKAYANGVILTNDDNCLITHANGRVTDDSSEPFAKIISHEDVGTAFINRTFYNLLKKDEDPRIPLIMCVIEKEPNAKYGSPEYTLGNSDPSIQKGLPGFYSFSPNDEYTIGKYLPEEFTEETLKEKSPQYFKLHYSVPNRRTYGDPTAPTFVMTAAQTNLLLAEAAQRGFINGKSAAAFYSDGVQAAMKQFNQYPAATSLVNAYLTDTQINAWLKAHPLVEATALEQINLQYYITCFGDEYETFANWRRSDYPKLTYNKLDKSPSLGVYEGLVRRFTYPSSESQVNRKSYEEALKRQFNRTTDFNFTGDRVWWDK